MRVLEAQLIEICDIYLGRLYSELDLTVILLALFVVLSQLNLWKNFNIIDGLLDAVVNDWVHIPSLASTQSFLFSSIVGGVSLDRSFAVQQADDLLPHCQHERI